MGWQGWLFDNRLVRALPDFKIGGFAVSRFGYNFRPKWNPSLAQPWYGHWWVWFGPYLIGWPKDFGRPRVPLPSTIVVNNREYSLANPEDYVPGGGPVKFESKPNPQDVLSVHYERTPDGETTD